MFRVGRQKTFWLRGTAKLGVFLTLTVGVRPAFGWSLFGWGKSKPTPAVSSSAPSKPTPPAPPPVDMVRGRVAPTAVRVDAGPSGTPIAANNPWRLFDGDGVVGFIAGAPTRVRAALPAGTVFEGLGAYGASNATLTVYADQAGTRPMKGLDHVSLSGLPLRWNRFEAGSPLAAEGLLIEIDPAPGGQAEVRELELWGSTPARAPTPPGSVAEALLTGLPPSAVSVPASPGAGEMSYPKLGPDGAASFRVDLTEEAMGLSRAFLVYDLEGLPHWSAARRRINGLTISGGVHAHRAPGGLQVEEISPSWLRAGTNEIQFLASNANDPLGYKVKNLRVVVVPAAGDAPAYAQGAAGAGNAVRALLDGRRETGVTAKDVGDGMVVDLKFATPSQPESLLVATDGGEKNGTITIDPVVQGKVQRTRRVTAHLQDLKEGRDGWSRIPLDATPTEADGVRVVVQGDDEHPVKGRIAEMRVTGSPRPAGASSGLTVSYPLSGECVDGEAYLLGFLRPDGTGTLAGTKLKVAGAVQSKALGPDGAFSTIVPPPSGVLRSGKKWQVDVEADFSNGDVVRRSVDIEGCRPPEVAKAPTGPVEDQGAPYGQWVHPGKATTLSFAGATLEIPAGAVTQDTRITVRPLGDVQVPATDETLTNVTIGAQAYRFGPHGMKFAKPVNLTIPYDRFRFPSGMSEEDLGVFFFDEAVGKWHQVQTVRGNASTQAMTATSTHFTDFITATIASPDHPTADSFNPNSIKDMKAPDPAAMIDVIQAPVGSPDGAAHLSYPLWVPPGRQGMQPQLSVNYNSSGGNGLLGLGWELSMSSIEVDTRFGVPPYNPSSETETYSLDGELLVADPNQPARSGARTFHRRAEGKFDKIIRTGAGPIEGGDTASGQSTAGYNWEVVTIHGVHYFYGSSFNTRGSLVGNGAFRWYLDRVEDAFGNQVIYSYRKSTPPFHPSNSPGPSADAVEMYPASIFYTLGNNNQQAFYRLDFELNGDGISTTSDDKAARPDPYSNARGGTIALMARRLVNIRVFKASTPSCAANSCSGYIRRYNFVYQTGEFGKSLLSQIRVCINEDGFHDSGVPPSEFYHHSFTYSKLVTNPSTGRPGFGTTETWGSVPNGGPGLANEISGNLSGTLMGGWGPGGCALFHGIVGASSSLDLPIPSPGILLTQLVTGVSPPNNDATTVRGFVDVNGDGLPDFVGKGGTFLNGGGTAFGGPNPNSFVSTSFTAPPSIGHANNFSVSLQAGAHELYEAAHQTVEHVWASSHDDQLLADIDGDGFVDYLSPNSFILNNRGTGFSNSRTWQSLPTGQSFMPASILQEQKDKFTLTDPTLRWIAPFSGHVSITGPAQKAPNTQTGSDGVVVLVQSYTTDPLTGLSVLTSSWSQKLTDQTPCAPTATPTPAKTPSSGCGTGRTISVKAGDRIYFRSNSIDSIDDDAVTWDPVVSYQDVTDDAGNNLQPVSAAQHALQEPINTGAFDFNQTTDFRLAGKPAPLWRDDSAGAIGNAANAVTVEITGTIVKQTTPDAVRVQVLKYPANVNPPTAPTDITPSVLAAPLTADQQQTINIDFTTTTVPGDRIFFQTSSATPVDPAQVRWTQGPQVAYRTYCRTATVQGTLTKEVAPTETTFCGTLTTACNTPGSSQCQIQNDPDPNNNLISTNVAVQTIPPYYQLPPWTPVGTPGGFVAPSSGTISFTSSTTGPTSARLMVRAIDTNHAARLLLDGVSGAVPRGGFSAVGPATSTPIPVTAGQSILFDVFETEQATQVTDASTWNIVLQFSGTTGTQTIAARRNYQLTNAVAGSGEFHGWSVIEWNGSQYADPTVFSESAITTALTTGLGLNDNSNNATAPVHLMIESPQGLPAGPNGVPAAVTVPVWRGSGTDGYIAAGGMKPSRLGKPGTDASFVFSSTSNDSNVTSAGLILSGTTSDSTAQTQAQLIDLNGDRYPDLVTNSGVRFNHVTNPGNFITGVTETGSFDGNQTPFDLGGADLRDVAGHQVAGTLGISSPVAIYTEGHPPSWASALPTLGIGYGHAVTTSELIDLNGDGLPDQVTLQAGNALTVRYNVGGTFAPPATYPAPTWETTGTAIPSPNFVSTGLFATPDLFGSPNSDARSDVLQFQDNAYNNIGAGYSYIGVNHTASVSRTQVDLIDINGDGLPDMVWHRPKEPTISIKFNQGDSFGPEVLWDIPGWQLPNGEGLEQDLTLGLGSNDGLAFTESDGIGASAGNAFYIETFTPAGCFVIEVGAGGGESSTGSEMRFDDIDGDGAPDQILRLANPILNVGSGDSNVYVRRNPAAGDQNTGVNLLQKVTTPLGGTIQLSYERIGHVVDQAHSIDMPDHQNALHQVFLDDQMPDFHNQMTWVLDYTDPTTGKASGFYSRDEREFFGFSHVQTSDGRIQTDRTYDTSSYARRHLLRNEVISDSVAHTLFRQTDDTYQDRTVVAAVPGVSRDSTFPARVSRTVSFYEGLTNNLSAPVKTTQQTYNYNNVGQVSNFVDFGDVGTADDINYTVNYATIADPLGSGASIVRPSQVLTSDGNGNTLRSRQATYEAHGAMQTLTDSLFGGKNPQGTVYPISNTNPTSSFTYDAFGNLQTSTDPTGYTLTYTYNPESNTFIQTITDSFGYSSSRKYDLNFGLLASTTDANEATQQIDHDIYGRTLRVFAPQDIGFAQSDQGKATVLYQYAIAHNQGGNVGAEPFWAMTQTKDMARAAGSTLDVVEFKDGFGRPRQTKTSATVSGVDGMIVSGKSLFDTQGRLVWQGFPFSENGFTTETTYNMFTSGTTLVGRPAKVFAYDVLNRVRAISTPDDKGPTNGPDGLPVVTTLIDYNAKTLDGVQRLVKTTQDPQQKLRTEFLSPRGEVLAVNEMNRVGTAFPNGVQTVLTTRYTYDGLSELVQTQDAGGNVTTASYDSLGNMVTLTSPDMGRTEWRHYPNGLLAAKETANLRSKAQVVSYVYDVNRLKQVVYPTTSENVTYTYGAPGAGNGQAGRISKVQDESGTEVRLYDQLGNESQMQRTMTTQSSSIPSATYTMSYNYDTLGRVLNMTYPDGEVVSYGYDAGGKPITVQGTRKGTTTNYVTGVIYNQLEQRVLISLGNGASTHSFYLTDNKRLQSIVTTVGTTQLQNIGYGYDLVGNLTGVSNNLPTLPPVPPNTVIQPGFTFQTYGYDDLYQLTTASGQYRGCACGCANQRFYTLTMQYDGLGNITRKTQNDTIVPASGPSVTQVPTTYDNTYAYSATVRPHAPSGIGTETLTYDADGNTQGTNGTFGPSRAFTWTEDDRLRTETDSGFTNTYLYDADGNRTHKRRTSIETWYVNPFYVVKGYTTQTKHVMLGKDRLVTEMATLPTYTNPSTAGTSTLFYYHPDHVQSTSYTTGSDGSILQHDEYFPTGETWISEAKNNDARNTQPWLFNAKELDETGLYYFGARYYNPKYSVWSSPDPILATYLQRGAGGASPKNLGLYSYAWNNPVVVRDPDGRQAEEDAEKGLRVYEFPELDEEKIEYNPVKRDTYRYNRGAGVPEAEPFAFSNYRPGVTALRVGDIDRYGNFNTASRRGDQLEGHELLGNIFLETHEFTSSRGATAESRDNPAVALTPAEHAKVTRLQRQAGLLNRDIVKKQDALQNILLNREVLKKANVLPDYVVETLYREAVQHGQRIGAIPIPDQGPPPRLRPQK
jgi:RHS repeat-associated protein